LESIRIEFVSKRRSGGEHQTYRNFLSHKIATNSYGADSSTVSCHPRHFKDQYVRLKRISPFTDRDKAQKKSENYNKQCIILDPKLKYARQAMGEYGCAWVC
jgi:hypothetical protein